MYILHTVCFPHGGGGGFKTKHICYSLLVQSCEIPQRFPFILLGSSVAMTTKSPVKMADSSFRRALARFRGLSKAGTLVCYRLWTCTWVCEGMEVWCSG